MGKRARQRLFAALLALLAIVGLTGAANAQVTITLVPSAPVAPPGGSIDVDVVVSGLGDFMAPSVGAFDLDVTFDDTFFAFTGLTFGPLLGDVGLGEALTGGPAVAGGTLGGIFELSLLLPLAVDALQPDSFTLFTVSFTNIFPGTSTFDAIVNAIGDENGDPLMAAVIPADVEAQSIADIPTLSPVGIVTLVLVLLGSGLLVLRRVGS